jgi:hypothetical protein
VKTKVQYETVERISSFPEVGEDGTRGFSFSKNSRSVFWLLIFSV